MKLLCILVALVGVALGDVVYSNHGMGSEVTATITFTVPSEVNTTFATEIVVTFPDFFSHGEAATSWSSDFLVTSTVVQTAAETTPLVVKIASSDIFNESETYTVVVGHIFTSYSAAAAGGLTVEIRNASAPTGVIVTGFTTFTGAVLAPFGNAAVQDSVGPATSLNTYFVAARSFLLPSIDYVVNSISVYFEGVVISDNNAALKVWGRASGNTAVPISQWTMPVVAGTSAQTLTFGANVQRPVIPVGAHFGFHTVNTLALSTCNTASCFGGHFVVTGDAQTSFNTDTVVPREVSLSIQRVAADTNRDLSGIALSTGTLSPVFNGATLSYTVTLPSSATSITVTPAASSARANMTISPAGGTAALSPSGSYLFTITVRAEAPSAPAKIYTVTVNVNSATFVNDATPVMGLIGTLGRVGCLSGSPFFVDCQPYNAQAALGDLDSYKTAHGGEPWTFRTFPLTLTVNANYLKSGLFFGVLVAGAIPNPVPVLGTVVTPPTILSGTYIDQFGVSIPINLQGGKFNFPNPDVAGDCFINITATVDYSAQNGKYYTSNFLMRIVLRPLTAPVDLPSSFVTAIKIPTASLLPSTSFGQFIITLTTLLGSPFDSWRFVVVSSQVETGATNTGKSTVTIAILPAVGVDPQRVRGLEDSTLRSMLAAVYATPDSATGTTNARLKAAMRALPAAFAIDFSGTTASTSANFGATPQVTPCEGGLWYLYGAVAPANQKAMCGVVPSDQSSADESNQKKVTSDALVGIFVGVSCGMVTLAFVYYKWIAKTPAEVSSHPTKTVELNETNTGSTGVVAVPATNFNATVDTPTANTHSTPQL